MEDGLEEIQNIVFAEGKSIEEAEETKERDKTKASGLVKNLIANLVPGNGGEEGKPGMAEDGGRQENDQKEGGIINHLISNLVSPRLMSPTPAADEAGEREGGADLQVKSEDHGTFKSEEEFEGGGGGGGIINNLISNMFHHEHGGRREEMATEKEEKAEAGGGSGIGLVDELIANLPTPLAEDSAPATDEASILIHSVVHD